MATALRQPLLLWGRRRAAVQSEMHHPPPVLIKRNSRSVAVDWSSCCHRVLGLPHVRILRKSPVRLRLRAASDDDSIVPSGDDEDGVSLGTMKLPPDTDLVRFETLLFQWANSLCQGANLPLPVPLKIDKISGGVRLGFITIDDGKTEVPVYIDCQVFPPTEGVIPMFRATRSGQMRDQPAPGEPRIMRSLLGALKKSVEIARL